MDEFQEAFAQAASRVVLPRKLSIATGELAYPFIQEMALQVMERFPQITIYVYPIRNNFFGEQITVSGLLTGQDLIAQLTGKMLGECVLLPQNVLKSDERIFLDDITVDMLEKALQVPVDIVKSSGQDFVNAVLGEFAGENLEEIEIGRAHV